MNIKSFIQNEVLAKRIETAGVMVVYDPARRYRELCLELTAENRQIVDATESSIESREAALAALQELGESNPRIEALLVYVPVRPPLTDEDKQRDPFSIYGACGTVFPEGDGDEYLTLCLKAKPDYATEIRRIFAQDANPSFAVIDAVGGGGGWPNLQALLNAESARDILFALLAPAPRQKETLKSQEAWVAEAKDLFRACLGLKLLTRGKTWASLADELWRFLLFSEFVFDLPDELPGTLADVPRAEVEGRPLVEDICDRLRNDRRTQADYIDRAESIEREMDLPGKCEGLKDLGIRDTFPFEDRSFFSQAVEAIQDADLDKVRQLLARRTRSIWVGRGENQARWSLLDAALSLIQACDDAGRQLPDQARSQETLIDFYVSSLREVDRLQREFEQNASDALDTTGGLDKVMAQARGVYRGLAAKLQDLFVKHLEQSGWPPAGRLSTADVFDRWVAPRLQESGRRVAYLLIDALRYELGVALEKQLAEDGQVELQAAFAPLPTVTPVGMAALLPGAGQALRLVNRDGHATAALGDVMLPTLTQRTEVLRTRYGQRFADTTLAAFVHGKFKLPDGVELLVIRSSTMDSHLESEPETTLGLIYDSLKRIRVAIRKLRELGFQDVVIATDHGFFLNSHAEAGDVCAKPKGTWLNIHERTLLGNGTADAANFVLPAERLGVRGEFNQVAGPRAMVAYAAGQWYFHGGASLQEAVVPVIAVRLRAGEEPEPKQLQVTLNYRRGAKRITTRLPVIEVSVASADLFSVGAQVEILLEAHDKKGQVVGEAKPGGPVNPATHAISLRAGEVIQVTLKMELDYEGKFTVKALDPTTLAAHARLDLETDYTV